MDDPLDNPFPCKRDRPNYDLPDYEQLCKLDALGLKYSATRDQGIVHEELKEQLVRNAGGGDETSLP